MNAVRGEGAAVPDAPASMRDDADFDPIAARAVAARAVELGDATPVPSPCTSVCRIHEGSGLCRGCFRTLAEIAQWSRMDDPGKRRIWACIAQRIEEATAP